MDYTGIIGTGWHPVKLRAIHPGTVTMPKGVMKYILSNRMLKKSASLSCSFSLSGLSRLIGLFGLSCLFGCTILTG